MVASETALNSNDKWEVEEDTGWRKVDENFRPQYGQVFASDHKSTFPMKCDGEEGCGEETSYKKTDLFYRYQLANHHGKEWHLGDYVIECHNCRRQLLIWSGMREIV